MTVSQFLNESAAYLSSKQIDSSRLDALIIIEFVLGLDRAKILSEPNRPISNDQQKLLNKYIEQRAAYLPISYITQHVEFYGREFYVNESVMQPRPESEAFITLLKQLSLSKKDINRLNEIKVADIGAGSGCLGITAGLEIVKSKVTLIDIDPSALKVAKTNVVLHTISINVIQANLLPSIYDKYDILICNLPYLPDGIHINKSATHEPKIALFGGPDGLDIYRKLFKKVKNLKNKPLYILTESLLISHVALAKLARIHGYTLLDTMDLVQVFILKP